MFSARDKTAIPTTEGTLRRLFFMLFFRGRSARGLRKEGMPQSIAGKLSLVLAAYAAIGLIAFVFVGQPLFTLATYLHGMSFVLVGVFVATSVGDVLFNKEEADILLHRPITPRALLWAKISVLLQVSFWLSGALNLAGFIAGVKAINSGWSFVPVHAVSMALEAVFCTATVVTAYQLCLRWFGRERLDGMMTTVQVVVSITLVLAGQIGPRLMIRTSGLSTVAVTKWWTALLPPAWFAGIDDALAGSGEAGSWTLAGLGVIATLIVSWLAFVKLAADYQRGLQRISETPARAPSTVKRSLLDRLVRVPPLSWWLRDSVARASFLLTASYLVRDRDVKLRMYPGIAPMLVLPIIMFMPARSGVSVGTFGIVFAGTYLGLIPLMALTLVPFSQQWQAADIFRIAPLAGPAQLCHGARRAVLTLLTLPMLGALGAAVMMLGRDVSRLVLILPGMIALPAYAMYACRNGQAVPFSKPPDDSRAAQRSLSMWAVMAISGVLSGIAVVASKLGFYPVMLVVETGVALFVYASMRASLGEVKWPSID
jgi:ABC-2 type transport system permease protein